MIGWLAALRSAESSEAGTLAEAVAHAAATVSGVDFDEVVARGRAAVERGICCDIYQLPDNELDGAAAIVGADIGATSVYDVRRFTYRAGSSLEEVRAAEESLGVPLPPRWVDYLTGPSVLDLFEGEEYLDIFTPADIADVTNAYYEWVPRIGAAMIAGDGGSGRLLLDTRFGDDSPVVFFYSGGDDGWEGTTVQADSIDDFIASAEAGTFEVVFDDAREYRPRV
ncbi:SMI1/KNR4 family protein [Gordonia otitidis]|uniref:Knr4/Smi1-like domain-containing protein n=1 Tax=Gordonia otitidis (strain DSM 44809 / CCUG 52243 / JCM 12355 / NBRC 100426 / IFM 10032) TaxID=1108044 RepID=H5TTP0_GORO1|nr:SMI1/KNR4 family protein [Gordonia otitidis]GAB36848.1 hypothetical protein GOOTI_241_00030 [Gordonia otitidis NBRC 100426]